MVYRTVKEIRPLLQPIEDAIRKDFLPTLFDVGADEVPNDLRWLLSFSIKHADIGIRNPVDAAELLLEASENATAFRTDALLNQTNFDLSEHWTQVCDARMEAKNVRVALEEEAT